MTTDLNQTLAALQGVLSQVSQQMAAPAPSTHQYQPQPLQPQQPVPQQQQQAGIVGFAIPIRMKYSDTDICKGFAIIQAPTVKKALDIADDGRLKVVHYNPDNYNNKKSRGRDSDDRDRRRDDDDDRDRRGRR